MFENIVHVHEKPCSRVLRILTQTNTKAAGLKIPKDSMDVLMAKLRGIKAEKRRNANAWVVRQLSKKQRDMLALLGLKLPPKTLR